MKRWGDWLIDSSLTTQNEGTWHTHKTGQKNYWRIRICVLHFFLIQTALSFSLLQFPISAMPLPNIKQFFSLFHLFRQCHCHKPIATKKIFFSYFGNAIATKFFPQFPPLYFGDAIATNQWPLFFFFLRNDMSTSFLQHFYSKS